MSQYYDNKAFRLHLSERMVDLTRVEAQRDALLVLVEKLRQWDMLDAAADGMHWKREIDATIKAVEAVKC